MPARTPDEIDTLFADALNAGDLAALVALYEPEASLMPSPGNVVVGKAAIGEALAGFLAAKPSMKITAMTGPDGQPATMSGRSVEVVRRQADGNWLFAIDFPFGVAT